MEKKVLFLAIIALSFTALLLSQTSAGFFGRIESLITGKATSQSVNLNITIGNSAPKITFTASSQSVTPTEDSNVIVNVNFTANDAEGTANLKDASARVNLTRSGETVRQNASCGKVGNNNATSANYTCTVYMWYFDQNGAWTVNTMINDTSDAVAINGTTSFTYNLLSAFTASPSSLTFPGINAGAVNTTASNDPYEMNNTGNNNFNSTGIDVNATDLLGETDNTKGLYATNFSIGLESTAASECHFGGNTTTMRTSLYTIVLNATLPRGNHTVDDGLTGQENLYYCLRLAGTELSAQSYSTLNRGAWTVRVS